MKARMSSKFGQIRPPTVELAALERLKYPPYTYKQWGKWCCHVFSAHSDRIVFIHVAGNESMHKSLEEFKFRPYPTNEYGLVLLECLNN